MHYRASKPPLSLVLLLPQENCVSLAALVFSNTGLAGREEHLPRSRQGLEGADSESERALDRPLLSMITSERREYM